MRINKKTKKKTDFLKQQIMKSFDDRMSCQLSLPSMVPEALWALPGSMGRKVHHAWGWGRIACCKATHCSCAGTCGWTGRQGLPCHVPRSLSSNPTCINDKQKRGNQQRCYACNCQVLWGGSICSGNPECPCCLPTNGSSLFSKELLRNCCCDAKVTLPF